MRNVVLLAAARSGWGSPLPARHGRGVAVHKARGFHVVLFVIFDVNAARRAGVDGFGHRPDWATLQLINGQRWALRHRVGLRLQPTDGNAGELSQGVVDIPFDVPNVRCEDGRAEAHVRIGWYRSVYNIQHAFAVGSSIDELAATANADSVQVLLVRPVTEYESGPNGLCRKEVDRHSSMPVF